MSEVDKRLTPAYATSDDLGLALLKVLGLPHEGVCKLVIVCQPDDLIKARVTQYVRKLDDEGKETLEKVAQQYDLVKRTGSTKEQAELRRALKE